MLTLVAAIVQVDEILLELARQSAGINSITVVLARDVALASGEVKSRDVVGAVAIFQLDRARTDGQSQQLVAEADAHDGGRGGLHQAGKVIHSLLAVSRVTRTVGNENAVEVVSDLVDGIVVREDGDGSAAGN